jgi:AcrR family transcriptional regulator
MLAGVPRPDTAPTDAAAAPRAPRMSPAERRDMLVEATLPLVTRHGPQVTTRQIAEAAGVAEGTIFRVFPDKEALVRAAVEKVLDPLPALAELHGIDVDAPLADRLTRLTAIMQRRFEAVFNLMIAMGVHGPPKDVEEYSRTHRPRHEAILAEMCRILGPDESKFRCPIPEVVRIMRLLTFAGTHPLIADGNLLTPHDIADVVLHGTLRHSSTPDERGQHPC